MESPIPAPTYPPGALVRVSDICGDPTAGRHGLLPISRNTWYRWVKDGRAPAPLKLGQFTTVWRLADVLAMARPAGDQTPTQVP